MKKNELVFTLAIIFTFFNAYAQQAVKRVLLEEFSTCPCGFCPEGGIIAEQLLEKYQNLISFTHHAGFGTDSMTIKESNSIAGLYTTFAPAGVIDRGHYKIPVYTDSNYIGISRQKWDSIVSLRLSEEAEADISLTNELNVSSRNLNVDVNFKFVKNVPTNDYRINIAIVEDSVSGIGSGWDQKNYFNDNPSYPTLYHKGDTIFGYIHRHVLRALPTGTWGLAGVFPNSPELNKDYSYKLSGFKIPDRWKIKDLKIIAFVSYYNASKFNHKILNSIQSEVNITETAVHDESNYNEPSIKIIPVSDSKIKIEFVSQTTGNVEIKIADIFGRCVPSDKYEKSVTTGSNIIELGTRNLSSGVYFCLININGKLYSKEFLIY